MCFLCLSLDQEVTRSRFLLYLGRRSRSSETRGIIHFPKNKGRQRKLNGGPAQMTKTNECLFPTLALPRSGSGVGREITSALSARLPELPMWLLPTHTEQLLCATASLAIAPLHVKSRVISRVFYVPGFSRRANCGFSETQLECGHSSGEPDRQRSRKQATSFGNQATHPE